MATKKYHYYIGIETPEGMRFVTKISNKEGMCYWNADDKPLELSDSVATSFAEALWLNGWNAMVIKSFHSIDKHIIAGRD